MITASGMATRLRQLHRLLVDEKLLENDAASVIDKVAIKLETQGKRPDWNYSITPSDPLRFISVNTRKVKNIQPVLQTKLCVTKTPQEGITGSFSELNSTLELHSDGAVLDRWHVDLANDNQAGPLVHLQHGGHSSGNTSRHSESKLSIPRWMHPPMDIVLTSELVVANFFPDHWNRLRKNPTWVSLVRDAESYCYNDYFSQIGTHFSNSSSKKTMLQRFWVT